MKYLRYSLLFLFLLSITNALTFTETFGTYQNVELLRQCNNFEEPYNVNNITTIGNLTIAFDNDYYCRMDDNNAINSGDATGEFNTNSSLRFDTQGVSNHEISLYHVFDEDITLTDDTIISGYFLSDVGDTGFAIIGRNEDGLFKFGLQITNTGGLPTGMEPSVCTSFRQSNSSIEYFEFGVDDIKTQCGYTFVNFTNIKILEIQAIGQGDSDFLDDVKISNYSVYSSNKLPIFNVTWNNSQIYKYDDQNSIEFEYQIDVYDEEGDTIYYAIQYGENYSVDEDFTEINGIFSLNDYDFTEYVNIREAYCNISEESTFETDKHNIISLKKDDLDVINVPTSNGRIRGLQLNYLCTGTPNFNYFVDYPIEFYEMDFPIYGFEDTANFSIILLAQDYEEIADFRFWAKGDNLSIFYDDNLIGSENISFNDFMNINIRKDLLSTNLTLKISTYDRLIEDLPIVWTLENNAILTTDLMQSIEFENTDTSIVLSAIKIKSLQSPISWTTVKPTSEIFYSYGSFVFKILVTDTLHRVIHEYGEKIVTVSVLPIEYDEGTPLKDNVIVDIGKLVIGDLLDELGLKEEARGMFWLAYLIILLLGFMATKFTNIQAMFLVHNVVWIFVALIFDLGIAIIASVGILLALSMTPLVSRLVLNNG